ncbi:hypothetical protein OS493_030192 [Desmophyllum pertusum]|uniref:Sodefrin-like factor n=1 Tax=Desmophyllum pertusum TaxID=174260 RepID=A0A9W9YWP2_9CNID|nr:hypothetical protein OS493_030192 [Desmophyllum pertusum]
MAEALPFLLVALLALCMMPSVFSLECYECTNIPGYPGVTKCDSDSVTTRTCPPYYDRCMTVKYIMEVIPGIPIAVEMKNCSNFLACDPRIEFSRKYQSRSQSPRYPCPAVERPTRTSGIKRSA